MRAPCGAPIGTGDLLGAASQPDLHLDWREVLARDDVDIVFVLTPPSSHHVIAAAAAARGQHVLVEKPLGITVRAARRAVDAARAAGIRLAVGHNYRFDPVTRAAQWVLESGRLGDPRLFSWLTFRGPGHWTRPRGSLLGRVLERLRNQVLWYRPAAMRAPAGPSWRYRRDETGAGSVIENGTHILDTARGLMGPIDRVNAIVSQLDGREVMTSDAGRMRSEVPDTFLALLRFASGAKGHIGLSSSAPGEPLGLREGFVVHCADGSVSTTDVRLPDGHVAAPWELFRSDAPAELVESWFPDGLTHRFALQQLDVMDAVRSGRAPLVDGEEGLAAVAAAHAAVEADGQGREVGVDELLSGAADTSQRAVDGVLGLRE